VLTYSWSKAMHGDQKAAGGGWPDYGRIAQELTGFRRT